jgi:hypothetical protein
MTSLNADVIERRRQSNCNMIEFERRANVFGRKSETAKGQLQYDGKSEAEQLHCDQKPVAGEGVCNTI